ncbi:C39 family peptidase [Lactiplantibacillus fabifermentans]|uniref:Peptidase C39-like domain-containing protein n=2 Tax=Lactiplantibacillus fabifermentans TaxID=483011 RepID=A0A0R2NPI7_9LACO|nr:C39 family peptidase [Lactiplantibacillus fabifermentans]ETY73829.1 hypothetical protein LFAB_10265 [Lactiplantibacillus fabifermentans T30PCM01]KRO27588.1 hypothetical protein DY78_GL003106 [Lactiplantibacillus fabifermentans DSM 21115]
MQRIQQLELMGVISLIGWGSSAVIAHASTPAYQRSLPVQVTHHDYATNSRTGVVYQLKKRTINLQPKYQLAHFQKTTWTWTQQMDLTINGKPYRYYYVRDKKGHAGWVWRRYLTPTTHKLVVPLIGQPPQLPTGCEITATTMMLQYAGARMNKVTLAKEMPRSNDPNKGFVGNPFHAYGHGLYVYPKGLLGVVRKHVGTAKNMTGNSLKQLKLKVAANHPVVAWVKGVDGFKTHSLTVTGYTPKHIFYNDPWTKKRVSMKNATFEKHWRQNGRRALSY